MSNPKLIAASLLLASAWAVPGRAVPSTTVTVSGQVAAPITLDLSGLRSLPQVTKPETYTAAGSPVATTFTGPTLWSVLQAAGGITTNSAVKNDLLQTYVIATGTDGYSAVISSGEIAPNLTS